jgi:hypothetical protein
MNAKELQEKMAKLDSVAGVNVLLREIAKLNTVGRETIIRALSQEMTDVKKRQFVAILNSEAVKTDQAIKAWLVKGITNVYVAGLNQAQELFRIEVSKGNAVYPSGAIKGKITVELLQNNTMLRPHLTAVNNLLSDAYLDFGNTITGFVRGSERILNEQLKQQIRSTIAIGRLEGSDIRTIKKDVVEKFKDKGFTVLLDKSGREWELERYSEMLARTHIIKANNEAVVNRASDFKVDIVEISSHGADDEICAAEEGKIYSISGKSENYEALAGHEPPFHPHCRHTLLLRPDLE